MKYGTVCSGISAESLAWQPLGWEPCFFSEIEPFASAALAHHYPTVPNLGDMRNPEVLEHARTVDLIAGGTPCQGFSAAGKGRGLDDERSGLVGRFLDIIDGARPRWVLWENVPRVLSIDEGKVFGYILGRLAESGYGLTWRVLDAQYFGVPQRRRRVFVVGYLGDWRRAAAVLFDAPSCRRHRKASRRRKANPTAAPGGPAKGPGRSAPAQALTATGKGTVSRETFIAETIAANAGSGVSTENYVAHSLTTNNDGSCVTRTTYVGGKTRVRRLTELEKERLMGVPDDYTAFPYQGGTGSYNARSRLLGNSMAVPVLAWIGRRIAFVEKWS